MGITDPDSGTESSENLYDTDTPVIGSSDDLIEVLYSLIGPEFDRLTAIDGGQDLILALGEEETRLVLGEDNKLRIDNLDHLASLDPEDFLTMRLYLNQDAGNVLWEYAFEHLVLGTQLAEYDPSSGAPLYVSADDPRVPLEAVLIGYAGRENKEPVRVRWQADGGATLETEVAIDQDYGIFTNELTLPAVKGTISNVSIELLDADSGGVRLPPVIVKAGDPTDIVIDNPEPALSATGVDEVTLVATVMDQHGNPVESGTGVSVFVEGSLHLEASSGATDENGKASFTLKGGDIAETANVRITAGEASMSVPVTVQPLNLEFVDADTTLFAGDSDSFQVRVTDYQGNPVPDAVVALGSNYGFLSETEVVTNGTGLASASITAPGSDGAGQITAQIGRSAWHKHAFDVVYPQAESRDLEVNNAMMVGDTDTAGVINHIRYDASLIELPYKVSETIRALGNEGDRVTVNIGDFRDPNLAPVAAYYMNAVEDGRVLDETGRYHLEADHVSQAAGTPMGAGRSLRFKPDNPDVFDNGAEHPSMLSAESAPGLRRANSLGFSIDLKPNTEGGQILNLGQGAQTLELSASGQLTFQVRTTDGTFEVESDSLPNHQWHRVAARYHNGEVELWVNGNVTSVAASGDMTHSTVAARALEVGKGFDGQLNSLKWFDWQSAPVMTFDDGATTATVTVGPDNFTELTLRSTGAMGAGGSDLLTQRVAIYTDQVRQYSSLVSREAFGQLAGQYADTLDTSAPPINTAGLDPNYQPVSLPFVSKAYAADGESSFAWSLINWFIPIEDFGIVLDQLGYLVSDPEKFDGMEFTIALVNTVTIFPPAKPLKLFNAPLRAMFRSMDKVNPRFARHFAGYLGKVVQRAKKGDFDTLWNTLPFLVLAAELYSDPDAREGLEFLFSTVDSADDVLSWVNYLGLPANGWEGDEEPPTVPAFGDDPQVSQALPLGWLVPEAQAQAVPRQATRVAVGFLGDTLKTVARRLSPDEINNLPDALKVVRRNVQVTNFRELREKVFSGDFLKSAVWMHTQAGSRALRNFIRGKSNARYNPFVIMGTMAYLGWESSCGILLEREKATPDSPGAGEPDPAPDDEAVTSEDLNCKGVGFQNKDIRDQIGRKTATVFASSLDLELTEEPLDSNSLMGVGGYGHGELFHLVQIAEYQLLHRAGGLPIKDVERGRWVGIFKSDDDIPEQNESLNCGNGSGCLNKRQRRVDIILGESEGPETWIELKSWSAQSKSGPGRGKLEQARRKPMAHWDSISAKGKTAFHRQFSLDRGAHNLGVAWLTQVESGRPDFTASTEVDEIYWYFQAFDVKNRKTKQEEVSPYLGGYTQNDSLRGFLAKRPLQKSSEDYKTASRETFGTDDSVAKRARLKTPSELVKQLAEAGFGDLFESLDLTYEGLED